MEDNSAPVPDEEEGWLLVRHMQAAMRCAKYELLANVGTFYGEIPVYNGAYASAPTLEACREELAEVLEEWVIFRVHKNLPLPSIDGIKLGIEGVAQTRGSP